MDREERITEDPRIPGGKPTVRGRRIPVDLVNGGAWRRRDILDAYPALTSEVIAACQRCAATGASLSYTTWTEFEAMLDEAGRFNAEKRRHPD